MNIPGYVYCSCRVKSTGEQFEPAENILMIDSRTREIASTVLSTWLVSLHSGVSQWIAKKNSHLNFCQLSELPLVLIVRGPWDLSSKQLRVLFAFQGSFTYY